MFSESFAAIVTVDATDAVPDTFPVTAPVKGPENPVAVTVPVTSNSVVGLLFNIPILFVDPSNLKSSVFAVPA